jgi:hypothetical protein
MAGDLDGRGCADLAVPGNEPPIGPSDVGIARVSVFLNLSAGCEKPSSVTGRRAAALKKCKHKPGKKRKKCRKRAKKLPV